MSTNREYQICSKTIMDTTDPKIIFDKKGCFYFTVAVIFKYILFFKSEENKKKLLFRYLLIRQKKSLKLKLSHP